jgi:hypothetical protein
MNMLKTILNEHRTFIKNLRDNEKRKNDIKVRLKKKTKNLKFSNNGAQDVSELHFLTDY